MKKIILIFVIVIIRSTFSSGQNLLPNPSFENYIGCPSLYAQFDSTSNWFNPAVYPGTGGSPDYYNQCATSWVSVPTNFAGYQQPKSGLAYVGLCAYFDTPVDSNFREYIEVKIDSSLIAGNCYHFEMYVSLANVCKFSSDEISVYFSDTSISGINNWYPLPFVPQINNMTGYLTDTTNWTLINGDYSATGGENYLLIGNFKNDLNTNLLPANGCCEPSAYYYIDDVSLIRAVCDTTNNGLHETSISNNFKIYPNPTNQIATLEFKNQTKQNCTLTLYDLRGQVVQTIKNITADKVEIERQSLASGLYFFQLRTDRQIIATGKLTIE